MAEGRESLVWEHLWKTIIGGTLPAKREISLGEELVHAAGTARIAELLAIKRRLDVGMAYVVGVLHDYGRVVTGVYEDHARAGGPMVKEYLATTGLFSATEINLLSDAVAHHSLKSEVGPPFDELIKDSDVLDSYLSGRGHIGEAAKKRLRSVFLELGTDPPEGID